MRPKNRLKEKLRPYRDNYLKVADISIGARHRKQHGDLQLLADSIAAVGLLQPIGITKHRELVFGERRLLACRDILGWSEIPARIVNVRSIVEGEFHENEVRKDFTPGERVAIRPPGGP
jgi:ParB family chromosome partitioning protein